MAIDPFEGVRCECGWVHFGETPCPPATLTSYGFWLSARLRKLALDMATFRRRNLDEAIEALR